MARKKPKFEEEIPRQQRSQLNETGHEIPDSRPVAAALKIKRQPTLAEQIKAAVRSDRLRQEAINSGHETFEEADDFDVGDDYDPESPYENEFDPPLHPRPQAAPAEPEPSAAQPAAPPEPTPRSEPGSA